MNKRHSVSSQDFAIKKEVEKMQKELEQYKKEMIESYQAQLFEEKEAMRKVILIVAEQFVSMFKFLIFTFFTKNYDTLMARIEKQRDEAEEERVKELIRKMNEECDQALKKQWADMEELKQKQIEQMRELIRKEMFEETEQFRLKSIEEALEKAEKDHLKRESHKMQSIGVERDKEWNDKMKSMSQRYDASIETLLQKYKKNKSFLYQFKIT
jgi:hypothetical protein